MLSAHSHSSVLSTPGAIFGHCRFSNVCAVFSSQCLAGCIARCTIYLRGRNSGQERAKLPSNSAKSRPAAQTRQSACPRMMSSQCVTIRYMRHILLLRCCEVRRCPTRSVSCKRHVRRTHFIPWLAENLLRSSSSKFGKQSTSRRSIVPCVSRDGTFVVFNAAGLLLGRVLPGSIYEEHWRREALSPVIKILCIRVVDIANRDLLENDRRCVRESATG